MTNMSIAVLADINIVDLWNVNSMQHTNIFLLVWI